jgi:hypothetical protein
MLSVLALAALLSAPPSRAPPAALEREPVRYVPPMVNLTDEETRAARALALADAGEPPVAEVQAAAARQEVDPAQLASLRRRPRVAAWLPTVTAEYRHLERNLRVVGLQASSEVDYARFEPGEQIAVRASWSLPDLVFSRDELGVAAAAAELERRARAAVDRATRLWSERRSLRVSLALDPPQTASAWSERQLELDRLTAELDAVTGGLYSRGGAR